MGCGCPSPCPSSFTLGTCLGDTWATDGHENSRPAPPSRVLAPRPLATSKQHPHSSTRKGQSKEAEPSGRGRRQPTRLQAALVFRGLRGAGSRRPPGHLSPQCLWAGSWAGPGSLQAKAAFETRRMARGGVPWPRQPGPQLAPEGQTLLLASTSLCPAGGRRPPSGTQRDSRGLPGKAASPTPPALLPAGSDTEPLPIRLPGARSNCPGRPTRRCSPWPTGQRPAGQC